jgi:hypothetical protein
MIAAQYDITLDRAAEYSFTVTVQNPAGSPVNLTGSTVYAEIRDYNTKKQIAVFSSASSVFASGQIVLSLTEADTKLLNSKTRYEWDLFLVRTGTATERLLFGDVTCRQNYYKGAPID